MMLDGLGRLGSQDTVSVETSGTELRGTKVVDVKVTVGLIYKVADSDVKIEVLTYEDGKLVTRQAGDGSTLWDYDMRSNTYSSTTYAQPDTGFAKDWKIRFFRTLRLRHTGVTSFTFRFLDEAFGSGMASGHWQPWIPTSSVERVDSTILCKAETPNHNELTYVFDGDDADGVTLIGAHYDQYAGAGPSTVKHWDTTVTTGVLPDKTEFGFIPPRGARMVSVEQHLGG